jgi:integrase
MKPILPKKELPFFDYFDRFITDSRKGKRLQPNGTKISRATVANYRYTRQLLYSFSEKKNFELKIKVARHLNKRELQVAKNYWKTFYRRFTDYLYSDCRHYDNYVGATIKNLKTFFNYLNKDLALGTGDFHKLFYVRKEEIAIFPLMPEELNYLITNKEFESKLTKRMKEAKDFFVFGCTVALRVSDLLNLKRSNVRIIGDQYYLSVRSIKTNKETQIKLPSYAIEIILKYPKHRNKLLPDFNKTNLNEYIKQLLERAGFTHPVQITREKRGRPIEIKNQSNTLSKTSRFCDVASTHTMRRTAITTMLSLGMPEQIVRILSLCTLGSNLPGPGNRKNVCKTSRKRVKGCMILNKESAISSPHHFISKINRITTVLFTVVILVFI